MRVRTLIDNINYIELVNGEDLSGEITGISYNSKKTQPNDVFICLTGEHVDGHEYAEEAVTNGAVFCVVERRLNLDIPHISTYSLIIEDHTLLKIKKTKYN